MAPSKTPAKQAPAPQNAEPLYPAIESFIEKATPEEVNALYKDLKEALAGMKGPRAEAGKKAGKGVERAEELLSFLLQVREKIEADRKGGGKGRR